MTTNIDHVLDRRSLRSKVTFWRIAALVGLAAMFIAIIGWAGAFSGLGSHGPHIARIPITGTITEDRALLALLKEVKENDNVKGVVLSINSPGGTTVGGEAIFNAVRELAETKPTATSVGTLAASAGYMIATASDHIVARHSSIIGSIGVIIQYPQASQLLDKIGVQMNEVKSSPIKAEPSPFKETPLAARVMLQELIDDSYKWFQGLVKDRRSLSDQELSVVADGSVFSGKRAMSLKLIDAIGGEEVAKQWIIKKDGLDEEIELIDTPVKREAVGGLFSRNLIDSLNDDKSSILREIGEKALPPSLSRRLFLDGLLSIWHG